MFLGLRMTKGVDAEKFQRIFGCSLEEVYGEVIKKNMRDGLLVASCHAEYSHTSSKRLALTEKGLDVCNYVMAQFLL